MRQRVALAWLCIALLDCGRNDAREASLPATRREALQVSEWRFAAASLPVGLEPSATLLLPTGALAAITGTSSTALAEDRIFSYAPGGTWALANRLTHGAFAQQASVLVDGTVLVAGGALAGGGNTGQSWLVDPRTWSVTPAPTLPNGCGDCLMLRSPTGGAWLLGVGGSNQVQGYEPGAAAWVNARTVSRFGCTANNGNALADGGLLSTCFGITFDLTGDYPSAAWYPSTINAASTVLANGQVLVSGGELESPLGFYTSLNRVQLFDPALRTSVLQGTLGDARADNQSLLLPDDRVLVVGGFRRGANGTSTVERYATTWLVNEAGVATPGPSLQVARTDIGATLLPDGRAIVVGGFGSAGQLTSVEVLTLFQDGWGALPGDQASRQGATMTLLRSGAVLVAGGLDGAGAVAQNQLYDPATDTLVPLPPMALPRWEHAATLLPNGRVLLCGGRALGMAAVASCELFDETTRAFRPAAPMATARARPTLVVPANGHLALAVGGLGPLGSVEAYEPATDTWSAAPPLTTAREAPRVVPLQDGQLVIAGGTTASVTAELRAATGTSTATPLPFGRNAVLHALGPAELFALGGAEASRWSVGASAAVAALPPRSDFTRSARLWDGRVLLLADSAAALYDAVTGSYFPAEAPPFVVAGLVVLGNGRVLAARGRGATGPAFALYTPGVSTTKSRVPSLAAPAQLVPGTQASLSGQRLLGVSGACDGTASQAACNFPLIQVRSADGEWQDFLPTSGWSETATSAAVPSTLPAGPVQLRAVVAGVPGPAVGSALAAPDGIVCSTGDDCVSLNCALDVCCPTACPAGLCASGSCLAADAGAGPADAGDGGLGADAGGASDGGDLGDAGSSSGDGGPSVGDAGNADAGSGEETLRRLQVGCGCGAGPGAPVWSLILFAVLRCRRADRAGHA